MPDASQPPLTVDLIRDRIWEIVRNSDTPMFTRLDARKIRGPVGYAHPSLPPAGLAIALGAAWPGYPIPRDQFDAATGYWVLAARETVRFSCPRYYVGRELVEACEQTQIDVGSMLLSDILWPLDTMIFMLPLGAVMSPSDEDLLYGGFALVGDGFDEIGGMKTAYPVAPSPPSVVFFGQTRSGSCFGSIGRLSSTVMEVTASTFDPGIGAAVTQIAPGVTASLLTGRVSYAAKDSRFLADLVALVVKFVLAMNSSPALREDGVIVKMRKVSKGQVKEEEWSPNYVGRHFKIERGGSTPGGGGGTVRSHWRRGHFRRQHYGEALSLVKTIWIQPILVGG